MYPDGEDRAEVTMAGRGPGCCWGPWSFIVGSGRYLILRDVVRGGPCIALLAQFPLSVHELLLLHFESANLIPHDTPA